MLLCHCGRRYWWPSLMTASCLRWNRVLRPSLWRLSSYELLAWPRMMRQARFCIFSICLFCSFKPRCQTWQPYSRAGKMYVFRMFVRARVVKPKRFRFANDLSSPAPLLTILLTWESHFRFLSITVPLIWAQLLFQCCLCVSWGSSLSRQHFSFQHFSILASWVSIVSSSKASLSSSLAVANWSQERSSASLALFGFFFSRSLTAVTKAFGPRFLPCGHRR